MQPETRKQTKGSPRKAEERERNMLLAVSQAIATVRDKQDLLRLVLEHLKPVFGFYDCGLFVVDPDGQHHSDWTVLLPDIDPSPVNVALRAAGLGRHPHPGSIIEANMARAAGGAFVLEYREEFERHPDHPFFMVMLAAGYHNALAARLQVGGQAIGAFYVNALAAGVLGPAQLPLFQAIADQVAVAVANILANEEILAREWEKTQLLRISEALAEARTRREMLQITFDHIRTVLPFADAGLFEVRPDGTNRDFTVDEPLAGLPLTDVLHEVGLHGFMPAHAAVDYFLVEPRVQSLSWLQAHLPEHPHYPYLSESGLREILGGPLLHNGRVIGMLCFWAREEGTFHPRQLALFKQLASLVATTVANLLANEEITAREREKGQLLEITELIAQVKATDDLLRLIVAKIKPLLGFHDCGLFVVSADGQTHTDLAAVLPDVSPSEFNTTNAGIAANVAHPSSLIEWMMATMADSNQTVLFDFANLVERFPKYPQFVGTGILEMGYRDCLAAPLTVRGQPRGFFCINALQKDFFRPAAFSLFQSIAHTISIAVANILAHEEILEREREKATLLRISSALVTIQDRRQLFRVIYDDIRPIFPYDSAGLFVVDEQGQTHYELTDKYILNSDDERMLEAQVGRGPFAHPDSIVEYLMQQPGPGLYDLEALAQTYPHPQLPLMLETGYRQLIAGPLVAGGKAFGMVCFNAKSADRYLAKDLHLFQAIAEQLAVVVSNILAHEDILAREQEKSVLLSISGVIATVRYATELLTIIREKAQQLIPFHDTGILLVEDDGQHHYDLTVTLPGWDQTAGNAALQSEGLHRMVHPGSYIEHVMELLVQAGQPIIENYEQRYTEFDYPFFAIAEKYGYREGIVAELRSGGKVFGTLWLNALKRGAFRPVHLAVFQALADQVAGAVANILAREDIEAREREKTVQLAVNNALVSSKDRESLCRALAGQMNQLVPFTVFVLCIWSTSDESRFQATLRRQPDGQFVSIQREVQQLFPPPLTPAERRALFAAPGVFTGAAFDALCQQYPLYHFVRKEFGVNSHIRLSLGELAGAQASIVVSGPGSEDFREADYHTLQQLIPQVSLALDNLLAFERLDRQRREKAAQVATTNALTSDQPFNELVRSLAVPIDSLVSCDLLHLCLLPPHAAGVEADVAVVKEGGRFQPLPRAEVLRHLSAETLAAGFEELRALASQTRLFVGDEVPGALGKDGLLRYLHQAQAMRAFLLVPLRVNGQLAAGLLLAHRFAYGFSAPDVVKMETLAAQMALALGNRFAFAEIATLQQQLAEENSYLQDEIKTTHNFEEIIGTSPPLLAVFQQVSQVAATDTTVCIGGETGTGKELIARALHNLSPRKSRLLVKVNCAALPAQLIESELFGHEKGSFTGAHERRIGKFELADGGTIFLDEIGEMPLELQSKLLRALQEKEVERVGGKGPIRTDVRIIAATNRDLQQEVQAGRFRQDLYFRLMVFPLLLPPLRKRREDIPALANHFLFQFAKKMGKPHKGIAPKALHELMAYDWPGNIRELQHTLEQAVIVSTKPLLELARPLAALPGPLAEVVHPEAFRQLSLDELERQHILATLRYTNGRIRGSGGAAQLLAIKATTLEARMKKLGVSKHYVAQ